MMNFAEYRKRPALLADYLPWAGLVAPAVVLNKDGSLQRTARFRCRDLESSTDNELVVVTAQINNALKRLGSGWALFVEATRQPAACYPQSVWPDALSWLVDEERRAAFEETGSCFETVYHLTYVFLPPIEKKAWAERLLFESSSRMPIDWRNSLDAFVMTTDRLAALLESVMPECQWLTDSETLSYLHSTVSDSRQTVAVPECPFHLDALLADAPLTGGLAPALGDQLLRAISVRGFPASTWPGLLDDLNRLDFPYRWVTRFICLDKTAAERELTRIRRHWFAKRKGLVTLLREAVFQNESPLVDNDAANKAIDADAALQELGSDAVAYGYVTAVVVVSHSDATTVRDRSRAVERVLQGRGFIAVAENVNAVEAWLGTIPANSYANVRQSPISTLNLAHIMPLSSMWAGPTRNAHLDGPALMFTRTSGATPFRLNLHVGDVGHVLVLGPTGSGKSVLLSMLALQFRRYAKSQVFVIDKGGAARATVLGLGGVHHSLSATGSLAFQPLVRIDELAHRSWAAEWIAELLALQHIEITPEVKECVWSALANLAAAPSCERTLTGLAVLMQSNRLRVALEPYTLSGPHGRLLDSDVDRLSLARVQGFELQELMETKSAVVPVLSYLFHRLAERFDGSPTMVILDEAWIYLDHATFAGRIREWLKTLRSKNVLVVFATQSLADIQQCRISPALIESCPTRIFLPSAQAAEPQVRETYRRFGLNDRQIELISSACPKREYYYTSPLGNRMFDLDIGPVARAFATAGSPEDQRAIDGLSSQPGPGGFTSAWLCHKGLGWAADILSTFPNPRSGLK